MSIIQPKNIGLNAIVDNTFDPCVQRPRHEVCTFLWIFKKMCANLIEFLAECCECTIDCNTIEETQYILSYEIFIFQPQLSQNQLLWT